MALLFTAKHRQQFMREPEDLHYHGEIAERIYIEGMAVLADLHYIQKVLSYRGSTMSVKNSRKRLREIRDNLYDPRSTRRLVAVYKELEGRLRALKRHYLFQHAALHNPKQLSNIGWWKQWP